MSPSRLSAAAGVSESAESATAAAAAAAAAVTRCGTASAPSARLHHVRGCASTGNRQRLH